MKVVLFCGGLGTRLREYSETIPKPLAMIGQRPIIWHMMRYYAHFGHKDFVLALGYRGDMVREYFVNYREWLTNDFVLSNGGRDVELLARDTDDWRITFVDTGLHSNIGERLRRVRHHLEGEEMFLANYSDALTNLPLDKHVADFTASNALASFVAVRPAHSFHGARRDAEGNVTEFGPLRDSGLYINGGYFVLRSEIFEYMRPGEELVEEPFQRLIEQRRLRSFCHSGFWQAMDTFKDKITYDRMEGKGDCPWKVWQA